MPPTDLRVHDKQTAPTTSVDGISIRPDVLFTDDKGEEATRVKVRSQKSVQKLVPALRLMLLPDESVLYVMRARSPLSVVEQLTAGWWTAMLAASAIVITNRRILFFPVKSDGSWKESVRVAYWGDLKEVKPKGLLVRNIIFEFKNGTKTTYTNFRRADARKFAAIASSLIPAASGEVTATQEMSQLCPDCRGTLAARQYSCPACGLAFKNEKSMILRSIFLPGGGYFYTGPGIHSWEFFRRLLKDFCYWKFCWCCSLGWRPPKRGRLYFLSCSCWCSSGHLRQPLQFSIVAATSTISSRYGEAPRGPDEFPREN